ncbi:MAG TPA: NPCBM/NEW2 domain-containing protein [Lacipirellulaceae bacterium]|nr:NPCBM/NEW2 domain-containing protein [Lacipirellulaceae bacterium]
MASLLLALSLSFALAEGAGAQPAVEATLLDGAPVRGRLASWRGEQLELQPESGPPRQIHRDQLLGVTFSERAGAAPQSPAEGSLVVELIDGSRLAAGAFTVAGGRASIATPYAAEPWQAPTSHIRRVDLAAPTEAATAAWRRATERELAGDLVLVTKANGGQIDYLSGVVGDVTDAEVHFDWDGQKVAIKRGRVAAIGFHQAGAQELPEPAARLALRDGSIVAARSLALQDGVLEVSTPTGARLALPLAEVIHADYSAGKLAYLGDMQPASVAWTPRLALPSAAALVAGFGAPRSNASFSGGQLSLAWPDASASQGRTVRNYAKGLALRSRTVAAYRVPAGMRRFAATAGIDPQTADQGSVQLEIRADDRVLWEGEVDGRQPPVELSLDLGGARRLELRVDYGRNLDYGDRLHLAEARVTK